MKNLRYLLMAAALVAIAIVAAACGSSGSSSSTSSGGGGGDTAAAGGDYLNGGFPATETPTKGGTLKMAMNSKCWRGSVMH